MGARGVGGDQCVGALVGLDIEDDALGPEQDAEGLQPDEAVAAELQFVELALEQSGDMALGNIVPIPRFGVGLENPPVDCGLRLGEIDRSRLFGIALQPGLHAGNRGQEILRRTDRLVPADARLDGGAGREFEEARVEVTLDPMLVIVDAGHRWRIGGAVAVVLAQQDHHRAVPLDRLGLQVVAGILPVEAVVEAAQAIFAGGILEEMDHGAVAILPAQIDHALRVERGGGDLRAHAEIARVGLLVDRRG